MNQSERFCRELSDRIDSEPEADALHEQLWGAFHPRPEPVTPRSQPTLVERIEVTPPVVLVTKREMELGTRVQHLEEIVTRLKLNVEDLSSAMFKLMNRHG